MAHGHETRIRELERRYGIMGNDLRSLRRRATAVGEGIRGVWADGLGLTPGTAAPCLTRVKGSVTGFLGIALAGATLQLIGHDSLTDYGTYTLPAGDFDINFLMADSHAESSSLLDPYVSAPGVRWATSAPSNSFFFSACSTRTGLVTSPTPASGYERLDTVCNWPVATSLRVDDSRFGGPTTIASTGGSSSWTGTGGGTSYTFTNLGVLSTGRTTSNSNWSRTALTCPDAGATKFDSTYTCGVAGDGYSAGDTIRVYEP